MPKNVKKYLIAGTVAFAVGALFAVPQFARAETVQDKTAEMTAACARGVATSIFLQIGAAVLDATFTFGAATALLDSVETLDMADIALSCGASMAGAVVADKATEMLSSHK